MGYSTVAAKSAEVFTRPTGATSSVARAMFGASTDTSLWPVCV